MAGHHGPDRDADPRARAQGAPPPGTGPPEGAPPQAGPEPGAAPHAAPEERDRPAPPSPPEPEVTEAEILEAEPEEADAPLARPEPAEESPLVAELDAKVAALEDRWLRAVADLDNLRKRMLRDMERVRAEERARVAAEFLPVIDNLDRALEHADAEPAAVAEGVRAIRAQAIDVMARLGFPRQDDEGAPFDPTRHEAVGTVADPAAKPGTVAKVLRPGYGENGRFLRPAMVVVATEPGQDGT